MKKRGEREKTIGPWTVRTYRMTNGRIHVSCRRTIAGVIHGIEFDETYGWQWEAREAIETWTNDGERAELIKPIFEE
jgi:hypothetical protein